MSGFDDLLAQANDRLKAAKNGTRIHLRGSRLSMYALLPPPPGSTRPEPFWQRIASGHRATSEGLRQIELDARQLGIELDRGTFNWNNWREVPEPRREYTSIGEWCERFERDYWERNDRNNGQSLTTWLTDYAQTFRRLQEQAGADAELTGEALRQTV